MCGIFGFVSTTPQKTAITISGLKKLEYRGYDSWGVAVETDGKLTIRKKKGKLSTSAISNQISNINSRLSIGHTRWATHGEVTDKNAHPHSDCTGRIAVVHNGIFENYEDAKNILIKKGHKFVSGTDTEVIAHLIEEHLKRTTFERAVQKTFGLMHGLNAIVVANASSNQIIAVKNGSPLAIGVSQKSMYIASDVTAITPYTSKVIILADETMAILGKKLKLISLSDGEEVGFKVERIKPEEAEHTKGKFPHFLLKEIYEQPKVLLSLYPKEKNTISSLADKVSKAFGTYMLGCGTSSYAALAGEYFFSMIAKKHVNYSIGSEFKYLQDFITESSLIIPISQSGETIDVVEPVVIARNKGAEIFPIVNVSNSTLSRVANDSLFLHAGQEKAVVGTKSFISMIGLLLLTAYATKGKPLEGKKLLDAASEDLTNILSKKSINSIKLLAKSLRKHNHTFSIGRGVSYATALEAALKLKETALVHAEGFAGGELKHGVIALIEKGTPCFVFAPNDETYSEIISNAQEIKARGGLIIGIGPKNATVFDVFLKTADLSEATIISQVVYMQLLAYYLAVERGIKDPDKPRNLAKSVTVK